MNKEFQMLAKTFKGLEQVLAGELIELGANNVQIERRAVSFTGDKRMLYSANFCLRTASRILVPIANFKAKTTDEIYEQIISIGEGDVMVAISFPRYSKKVVNTVAFAKNSGAGVIALTDSEASPIAAHADQTLYARSDMASFADSLVAPLSVINALVVAVSRKKQDELTVRLHQLEQIWEEYNVYDTNQG